MKRTGRILVVDDLEKWREALTSVLKRGGFEVDAVGTIRDASERVQHSMYHVLVLDIRMVDPDESNVEGMTFLSTLEKMDLLAAFEIIMLSSYGTREQMRASFKQYDVADFLTKEKFSGRKFLSTVRETFSDKVQINLDLDIQWQTLGGPEQAVIGLLIDKERVKSDTAMQKRVAGELEDLLCRLFFKANSLLVLPLAPGHSGAGVLRVQPFYESGAGQPVIVKFGEHATIDQEYRNFKADVEPFIGGGRRTAVLNLRRTPLLGGIVYSMLGTASEHVEAFDGYYRHADMPLVRTTLDRLFNGTCGPWYGNLGDLEPVDLTKDYQSLLGFSVESLQKAAERLKSIQGDGQLKVAGLASDRALPDPIPIALQHHLIRVTYKTITHGDLNPTNILVDEEGHPWLIDFLRTGKGHILRDIAELDTAVRIQLLAPEEATLAERVRMEEALLECNAFSKVEKLAPNFPTENQTLAKAYATSVHLRNLARKKVANNPADDIGEYYIALMYYALNAMRFYSLPKLQREHAYAAAGLLAECLGLKV